MTKDVLIEFSSVQYGAESVSSKTEYTVQGVYYEKNKKHYLLYDEVMEGFKEPVKNKVKFGKDNLEIIRSGPVNVRMFFESGKKNVANYNTPYGEIQLGINTKKIIISHSPDNISINVEYSIESDGQPLSECIISIKIQPSI
ncbi:MAG: DUF1934 domain-containing protein [Lachnospiraceae bacterium]|nr:DUF1934 domain-containing protein [Lachnospiraceae bacterium]